MAEQDQMKDDFEDEEDEDEVTVDEEIVEKVSYIKSKNVKTETSRLQKLDLSFLNYEEELRPYNGLLISLDQEIKSCLEQYKQKMQPIQKFLNSSEVKVSEQKYKNAFFTQGVQPIMVAITDLYAALARYAQYVHMQRTIIDKMVELAKSRQGKEESVKLLEKVEGIYDKMQKSWEEQRKQDGSNWNERIKEIQVANQSQQSMLLSTLQSIMGVKQEKKEKKEESEEKQTAPSKETHIEPKSQGSDDLEQRILDTIDDMGGEISHENRDEFFRNMDAVKTDDEIKVKEAIKVLRRKGKLKTEGVARGIKISLVE